MLEKKTKKEFKELHKNGLLLLHRALPLTAKKIDNILCNAPAEKIAAMEYMPTNHIGDITDYTGRDTSGIFTVYAIRAAGAIFWALESIQHSGAYWWTNTVLYKQI